MIESERNIVNTATVHLDNLSEPSLRPPTVLLITPHVQVAPDSILPALQSVLSLCLLTLRVKRVIHVLIAHNKLASAHKPLAKMHDLRKAAPA